ncbi:MAG: hypothetical protein PHT62_08385 [Desulfotomaculaceae bacterium]|nr:hypothetical protein [Desulfotomaculaceae bacterium]
MGLKDEFLLDFWNVGVVEASIEDIFDNPNNMKIRWVQHKYRDRYFADPFLCDQDQKYYYIVVEEYVFSEAKGKISRLTVDKKTLELVHKDILLKDQHHLSYPYLFEDYIIPEGFRSGATYAYKSINGGQSYRRIKLCDQALVDPTLLKYDDKYWIFATTRINAADAMSNLRIFFSKQFGGFAPHAINPVKTDLKTARPGGRFFEYRGKLYRPVQDCEESYGHLIRIMEVKKLSVQEYEEQEVMVLSSQNSPPFNVRLHTFNVYEDCIVVDGYREDYSCYSILFFLKLKNTLRFFFNRQGNKGKEIIVES